MLKHQLEFGALAGVTSPKVENDTPLVHKAENPLHKR
jgi:hypothetical protein